MNKKCGFLDCNNPAEKGTDSCPTCQDKEEYMICSACRQRQPQEQEGKSLVFNSYSIKRRKIYQFISKLRNKAPARFHSQIDQALPQFKLTNEEEKLIDQGEKIISDFLTEKGGKQYNIYWIKTCSVCSPEISRRMISFSEQHPQFENIKKKFEAESFQLIYNEIKQEVGKERMEEIENEI